MAEPSRHASGAAMLWELTRVRLLETIREPEAVFWVFVFPVLLAADGRGPAKAGPPRASFVLPHRAAAWYTEGVRLDDCIPLCPRQSRIEPRHLASPAHGISSGRASLHSVRDPILDARRQHTMSGR